MLTAKAGLEGNCGAATSVGERPEHGVPALDPFPRRLSMPSRLGGLRAQVKGVVDSLIWKSLREHVSYYDEILFAIGQQRSAEAAKASFSTLREAEFRVFSQWGEDGILQYLLRHVAIERETFVEIGVADYREANTRFLLMKDDWRGLIVNAGEAHVDFLTASGLRWRHDVDAVSRFVTRENVNEIVRGAGFTGDVGLLSIDIDGNDYWVWESIDVIAPRIVVIEYNSVFGPELPVSVPYDPSFAMEKAHWSQLYYGASLPALCYLAEQKGYRLVGSNRDGCNAFFVRNDVIGSLESMTAEEAYVESRFRSSRDRSGNLSYVSSHDDRRRLIAHLDVCNVRTGDVSSIGTLFGLSR
jgi:hypothetical protein